MLFQGLRIISCRAGPASKPLSPALCSFSNSDARSVFILWLLCLGLLYVFCSHVSLDIALIPWKSLPTKALMSTAMAERVIAQRPYSIFKRNCQLPVTTVDHSRLSSMQCPATYLFIMSGYKISFFSMPNCSAFSLVLLSNTQSILQLKIHSLEGGLLAIVVIWACSWSSTLLPQAAYQNISSKQIKFFSRRKSEMKNVPLVLYSHHIM